MLSISNLKDNLSFTLKNSNSKYSRINDRCNKKKLISSGTFFLLVDFFPNFTYKIGLLKAVQNYLEIVSLTSSRNSEKCGSCVHRPNMIRSASRPYKQCLVFGS